MDSVRPFKMKPILSVIMPMYNSTGIERNLREALQKLDALKVRYELILVDDGSTTNSLKEAKRVKNRKLKIVGYTKNEGKGNAIKYGFKFCSGTYVAFVDSGRDINPSQIGSFLELMKKSNADIVIGSKRHPESKVHYPLMRRVMSRTYQTINHLFFNLNVQDTQVGIKLFKYKVLANIFPKIAVKKFAFDLELLVIATRQHYKIVEAPVEIRYQFKSTVNAKAVFWILWDTAAIFYRSTILHYYD